MKESISDDIQIQEPSSHSKSGPRRYLTWCKRLGLLTISVIMLYAALWGVITASLSYTINSFFARKQHQISWWNDESYSLSFDKASLHGFPFKISIELTNIVEESEDSVITHEDPLYVGYDLIKQRFYAEYNGISTAKAKPLASGFGSQISGRYHYYLPCPLRLQWLKILANSERKFELVNYIKSINFAAQNIKVHDLMDKSMTFDAKQLMFNLEAPGRPYYHNIEELRSNIPSHYHLVSVIYVDKSTEGRKIAPISLIYGAFPMSDFVSSIDLDLTTSAKTFDFTSIVKNMDLKINPLRYTNQTEDIVGTLLYKSLSEGSNFNMSVDYSSKIQVKDGFTRRRAEQVEMVASELLRSPYAPILRPTIEHLLKNIDKYIPDFSKISQMQHKIVFDLAGKDNAFDLSVKDASMIVDDTTGYISKGDFHINDNLGWQVKGQLMLSNYQNIISFLLGYGNAIQTTPRTPEAIGMLKETAEDLFKITSDHPESKGKNIAFDYEFSSKGEGKIGKYTMPQILEVYYKSLYRNAIIIAQKSPDPMHKLQELLPEAPKELIEALRKQSNEAIIQPLAK
ncbi:MAG: hypothetical protein V4485_00150 [Pseudomonadota bacterium]